MQSEKVGAHAVFSGAMANPVTRYAKTITVIADATFSVLKFKFDADETEEVNPNTLANFPALLELTDITSFQLASGDILVAFGHGKT